MGKCSRKTSAKEKRERDRSQELEAAVRVEVEGELGGEDEMRVRVAR